MADWNEVRREYETSKITLAALAKKHDVKLGTLKSRKSREKWSKESPGKVATKNKKDATIQKRMQPKKEHEPVIENEELTDKQKSFCLYYIKYFNVTKAYQKAYKCDYSSARSNGARMIANDSIKREINRLNAERQQEIFLGKNDILQKYIDIAFADITDFVEFGTEEVPGGELEEELTGVDQSYIANFVRFKGDSEVDGTIITEVKKGKDGVSVKLADKMKALEVLTKYFELLPEHHKRRLEEEKIKAEITLLEGDQDKNKGQEDWKDALLEVAERRKKVKADEQ
jgi:phage terminase small subunit